MDFMNALMRSISFCLEQLCQYCILKNLQFLAFPVE